MTCFNVLGSLLVYDMADEAMIVPIFGFRARAARAALSPYITTSGSSATTTPSRPSSRTSCARARDNQPVLSAYQVRLRRL